jgi:hypothetical protein
MAAPVYKPDAQIAVAERRELWETINDLKSVIPHEMYTGLQKAMTKLDQACIPSIPISRAGSRVGMGLDKAQKNIVCDHMISIVKQIKALKAW